MIFTFLFFKNPPRPCGIFILPNIRPTFVYGLSSRDVVTKRYIHPTYIIPMWLVYLFNIVQVSHTHIAFLSGSSSTVIPLPPTVMLDVRELSSLSFPSFLSSTYPSPRFFSPLVSAKKNKKHLICFSCRRKEYRGTEEEAWPVCQKWLSS